MVARRILSYKFEDDIKAITELEGHENARKLRHYVHSNPKYK